MRTKRSQETQPSFSTAPGSLPSGLRKAVEPWDARVPGLSQALDLAILRSQLQPLFAPSADVEDVELHHLTYNPGKSATIAYRLQLRHGQGSVSSHFMAGLLRTSDKSRSKAARLRSRANLRPTWGPAFHFFEEADLILLGFPNDPKLEDLDVLEPQVLSQRLVSPLGKFRVESGEILRYVPGKRLVMRHALAEEPGSCISKTVARGRGRTALSVAENLWRASQSHADAFQVPRILGSVPPSQVLVQEDLVHWTPMRLPPADGWSAWGERVGRAVARVHRTPQTELQSWSIEEMLEALAGALKRLERFDAQRGPLCQEIWERGRQGPGESPAPEVPVHTAFRVTQMLERSGHLALLDLEGFRHGDPHDDLANLSAYLIKLGIEGRLPESAVDEGIHAFLSAYAAHVPWSLSQEHLDWFTAVHLVAGYATTCVSRLEERRGMLVPALLSAASRRFPAPRGRAHAAAGTVRGKPPLSQPAGMPRTEAPPPMHERLRLAADPAAMRELLAPLLAAEGSGASLQAVDVLYVSAVPDVDFRAWYAARLSQPDGTARREDYVGFIRAADTRAADTRASGRFENGISHGGGKRRGGKEVDGAQPIPRLGMRLWKFPADPKLDGLKRLEDETAVRQFLEGRLSLTPDTLHRTLVRYIPGKRAVLRYDVSAPRRHGDIAASRTTADSPRESLYCKVYGSRKTARRAAERCEALWNACRERPRAMPIPLPIAFDETTASLWFRGFPGRALDETAPEDALQRMGTGLAALHGASLSLPSRWSPAQELESAQRSAGQIAKVQAHLAEPLGAVLRGLEDGVGRLDFGPLVPCHGSFKLNHVLWDGEEARLLDVDSALSGSPWLDVANLMSHLHYLTCQGTLDAGRAQDLTAAFRSGYQSQTAWTWNEAALNWCMASLLIRKQAYKCVKHLHAGSQDKLVRLLLEAAARCGRLQA